VTDKRNPETQVIIEETIRLGFLIAALLAVYKWQWIEMQLGRIATVRDRRRNDIRLAEIQVSREISMMEHGQHENPVAFQQP